MPMSVVQLPTPDGACRTEVFVPQTGAGPWPGVVFCMDGGGQRQALQGMAQRLADAGYVVALPDLFHRAGDVLDLLPPGTPRDVKHLFPLFRDPAFVGPWRARFYASATKPEHLRADVGAVLQHLAAHPRVKQGGVGVVGYCMGGHCTLRLAALFPEQVAAAASFHGGMLASPAPDSPHLDAPRIKARLYVGGAQEDPSFTDEMKAMLVSALEKAGVDHVVESYPARHGFAVPDSPVYDQAAAERHFTALTSFFERSLKAPR